jgi:chorismate lyase
MNLTSLSFPYGGSIQWFSPEDQSKLPSGRLRDWLLAGGSLTERLKARCQHFDVRVLGEAYLQPTANEFPAQQVWVREVLLCLDEVPWVFARTLIPGALMARRQSDFIGLGSRPLGELLFSSDDFTPGRIEVASIASCSRLAQLAQSLAQPVSHSLWGRRRYFSQGNDELVVSEIFLPAAEAAICHSIEE